MNTSCATDNLIQSEMCLVLFQQKGRVSKHRGLLQVVQLQVCHE